MKSANIRKPHTLRFCQHVVPGQRPVHVPHEPIAAAEEKECFSIVPKALQTIGGEQVFGWLIWEWPRVLIEAEFHTVLRTPQGQLVDLTPQPVAWRKVTFLEDPQRRYEGRLVNNIRQPLRADPMIDALIEACDRHFERLYEADLADQHGELPSFESLDEAKKTMLKLHEHVAAKYGGRR